MTANDMQGAVEAILFAAGEPLEIERIAQATDSPVEEIQSALSSLSNSLDERESGICLVKMENKYQLCTRQKYAEKVRAVLEIKKNSPLSNAAFEVLAVVAYNQPVTKSFIERVRGVDCSGVIQTLILKGLVEERGRLELPGRPLVYGTTSEFLKCFCVSDLDELPELPDHEDLPKSEEIPNQMEIDLENGDIVENRILINTAETESEGENE